jgi:ribosomal-protein-alanine N-acetyltransferase
MKIAIRPAEKADILAIVSLEQSVFPGDRLSRRSLTAFVTSRSAVFLVAEAMPESRGGRIAGYVIPLFRKPSRIARLYSVAVSPDFQGQGVARRLIEAAEATAAKRAKTRMRLEVRADNRAAIALYLKLGYKPFGNISSYYDDGADALRFEKTLK